MWLNVIDERLLRAYQVNIGIVENGQHGSKVQKHVFNICSERSVNCNCGTECNRYTFVHYAIVIKPLPNIILN